MCSHRAPGALWIALDAFALRMFRCSWANNALFVSFRMHQARIQFKINVRPAWFLLSNADISMLFPPDTDTPGFAEENKIKPRECSEVCGVSFLLAYAFGCLYRCPRPSLASPLVFTLYMSPGPTYTLYTCMQAPVPFAYLLLVHTTNYPTCQVSAAGGLFSAQDVAAACLNGIKKNKYTITVVCALPR